MEEDYQKQAFVLSQPPPGFQVPKRLGFRPVTASGRGTLVRLVALAMARSLDRSDQYAVRRLGAERAATEFLAEAPADFDYSLHWWEFALNAAGQPVGFVLPVLFRGAEKEGLGEGTFYYMGVTPEHRGNNYVFDLLCRGTATLEKAGVWRIYSDTDVRNHPMISAFVKAGYEEFGPPKKASL